MWQRTVTPPSTRPGRRRRPGGLVPIFGLAFAALLLGEPVGPREIVAAVLVLGGVLLTLRAPQPQPLPRPLPAT